MVHICNGILLSQKKEQNNAIWVQQEIIVLREVSQEEDRYHMIPLKRMTRINLSMKQTHGGRAQTCGCSGGEVWGRDGLGGWDWQI